MLLAFRAVLVVACGLHLFVLGARAQGIPSSSDPLQDQVPIEVTAADRLTIRFQGYPELTGDYRVDPDATISVPVIGRLPVSSMTPLQLEQLLARRASEISSKPTYVTVEISEYRPVFVTGYVTRPGSIQWRPGGSSRPHGDVGISSLFRFC